MQFPIVALPQTELAKLATPKGLEAVPDVIFDTALYTSGTTTTMNFFSVQQNDLTLSNLNGSGTLPGGNWFRPYFIGLDVLADATTSGAATEVGIVDDIQKLMLVGRPVLNFKLNGKDYWQAIPASFLHTSGGATGFGYGLAAAADAVQFGNNSLPDGGFGIGGAMIIPPTVQFSASITWTAAQTLRAGNTRLRLWLAGTRHRPIQ